MSFGESSHAAPSRAFFHPSIHIPSIVSYEFLETLEIDHLGVSCSGLWGFLAAWRALFDRFDADGSGNISFDEFTNALVAFGYRLSPGFVHMLYTTYDKSGEGRMSFDLFVQSCIILKRMTDVFKKYDEDRDGYITLSFEQFLTGEFVCARSEWDHWCVG